MPIAPPARLLAFVALPCAACTGAKTEPPDPVDTAPVADPGPGKLDFGDFVPKNVVIVNVDTLRADALPPWGSLHDTLPNLMARPGWVVVDRAVATSSWTGPTTTSELTGLDLPEHGVRYMDATDMDVNHPLRATTFATHLQEEGYDTIILSGNGLVIGDPFRMEAGFSIAHEDTTEPGNAATLVEGARTFLAETPTDQPFVMWLQPVDPHEPLQPEAEDLGTWSDPANSPVILGDPPEAQLAQLEAILGDATPDERAAIIEQVRDLYDEQILGVDRAVESLIEGLEETGRLDDTLVVLAADHGQSLFEGDPVVFGHGQGLRNEQVHVPMMFWSPALTDAFVPCVASGMDLFPTVLDALGVDPLPDISGQSLLDGCRDHAFSGVYESEDGIETLTYLGVETHDAQIVYNCVDDGTQAFDLDADPLATTSIPVASLDGGPALQAQLDDYVAGVLTTLPDLACAPAQ
jgi:arylsulfatase A-like enzyme